MNHRRWNQSPRKVEIVPEYCPEAVLEWYKVGSDRRAKPENGKDMVLRAKQHLMAIGWSFWYIIKQVDREELRYTSPSGKTYISLVAACKACVKPEPVPRRGHRNDGFSFEKKSNEGESFSTITGQSEGNSAESVGSSQLSESPTSNGAVGSSTPSESPKSIGELSSTKRCREGECLSTITDGKHTDFIGSVQLSESLESNGAASVIRGKRPRQPLEHSDGFQEPKRMKASKASVKQGKPLNGGCKTRMRRSSKRARQAFPSSIHQSPLTILSYLIDNNVALPRAKVYYMSRKYHRMAEGRITREGIRCNCCQKIFSLSNFETHAGSTSSHPAANIFLEDGRSLIQCQEQLVVNSKMKGFKGEARERIKRDQTHQENDYICSICNYGGTLLLCDHCPSAFHLNCLGLEALPEGDWFCPCCRCGICGQSDYNQDIKQFTHDTVLYCDQCEREYHVGCIEEKRRVNLLGCPKGDWFCSEKCEQVFLGLHKLLGKPIQVGTGNLTWTILRYLSGEKNVFDGETAIEHHSKLNLALNVMHECFDPIKDLYSKRDVVEDVLFNRRSELNRLNFLGFYTVLLERGDELVSVATVRIYGEKVAEIPLVATRFQYRRQGMCHILMDMLEKKLAELGVHTLVLPAISQVLRTWTTSFGFSKFTDSGSLKFLGYNFLNFPDTTMCQKPLKTSPQNQCNEQEN